MVFEAVKNHFEILFLLADFHPGGAEKVTINLANGMHKRGCKVKVVCLKEVGDFRSLLAKDIEVLSLDKTSSRKSIRALKQVLEAYKGELLFSSLRHLHVLLSAAKKLSGCKAKMILREPNDPRSTPKGTTAIKAEVERRMCSIAYESADLVISQGQEMAELMQMIYGLAETKVEVLYSPVINGKVRKSIVNPFPKSTALRVLNVARIAPAKDQMTLLEAFQTVLRRHQDAHLFLLGSYAENDPYYCSLVEFVKDEGLESAVTFLGEQDKVEGYLQHCDVFVLSSKNEGMPGALIEAMNYQCKVVSTACPVGPKELLADQYPESLVPVGDPDMMARAIWMQLQQSPKYKPVYNGLERFHTDSSLDIFYQHFLEIA